MANCRAIRIARPHDMEGGVSARGRAARVRGKLSLQRPSSCVSPRRSFNIKLCNIITVFNIITRQAFPQRLESCVSPRRLKRAARGPKHARTQDFPPFEARWRRSEARPRDPNSKSGQDRLQTRGKAD